MAADESTVTLLSSDGHRLVVEKAVAMKSLTLKAMIEEKKGENEFWLKEVSINALKKAMEYLHDDTSSFTTIRQLTEWEERFLAAAEQHFLVELSMAANYLKIEDLVYLTTERLGSLLANKKTAEIQKLLNINP